MTDHLLRTTERHAPTDGELSRYELDTLAQPRALRDFLDAPQPLIDLRRRVGGYERIILTGIGSSHIAGLRTWRRLVAAGLPVWRVDTAELLESLDLITSGSLLIITSQSGASGETVALLAAVRDRKIECETIGITNDVSSPLGRAASVLVPLYSGREATVSTKSYINTLAAHELLTSRLLCDEADTTAEIEQGLVALANHHSAIPASAAAVLNAAIPRIAFVGSRDHAATALYGGLVVKEAAKLPAEGFVAGNFRHGPLEIAGPGLAALFIGVRGMAEDEPLRRLARDVAATGATVFTLGDAPVSGCEPLPAVFNDGFLGLAIGALVCQHLSVSLARAGGVVPGEFRFGRKVTAL